MRTIILLFFAAGLAGAQSKVDATIGWTYTLSDEGTGYANLNSWYGSLSYSLTEHLGLTFEHESY